MSLIASTGSVTTWIGQLKEGDEAALAKLHARYWSSLVALARKRLHGVPGRAADEEDVAQEAFWSFYRTVRAGRAPRLENRHDLLALLTHIVTCQAANQIKHELGVQKRAGPQQPGQSDLEVLATSGQHDHKHEPVADTAGTPLEQAILNDCYQHYVTGLPERLRSYAELYLAGFTNRETAERMRCSERTVERKIALILNKWRAMAAESLSEDLGPAARPKA